MNSDLSYVEWKRTNSAILSSFSEKNVILLYSGGKDSTFALDLILRAGKEFSFDFKVLAGAFPNHRYPDVEKEKLGSYWQGRGADIIWYDLQETDDDIEHSENPCIQCREIRKIFLKSIVSKVEKIDQLVIIISFSLWDLIGYSMEHILGDILTGTQRANKGEISPRFRETAQRFYPFIVMKEGYSIFKPIIQYNGNYIEEQLNAMKIPVLSVPCKYKDYRPKRIFEAYYNKMGLSFNYEDVFYFAEKALNLPPISKYSSIDKEKYFTEVL
jgi:tRNA(Ile)-lysidine synthase TilS/MesJ